MPIPKLDEAIVEYTFAQTEKISARVLDPLKLTWIQTKHAKAVKEKALILMPEDITLSLSYVQKIAELEGRINAFLEILRDHYTALKELNEVKLAGDEVTDTSEESTAKRAAQLVNRQT